MASTQDLIGEMKKEYGEDTIVVASSLRNTSRIPTGAFPFDLATGGGFPMRRISYLYGMESSFKTNLGLMAIANMQRIYPDLNNVFVEPEGSYDAEWGASLGVDNDRLIHVSPDYAEQVVDIIEGFLYADDIGIVLLDSIASMVTANEASSSADKAVVGGNALAVGKLYRKATLALSKARKDGRSATFIAINQIRMKIGVMFGNPETQPGGKAFPFGSSLSVRLSGSDKMDTKIHPTLPAWKTVKGNIHKHKVPIVAKNFELDIATINSDQYRTGESNIWPTLSSYLKDLGYLYKADDGEWKLFDESYRVLKDIKDRLKEDIEFADMVKARIIQEVMHK